MKIKLSSVRNIRDFSEYGYGDYIRCAHLNRLSKKDANILVNKYNLKTIIDLRTPYEIQEKPDAQIPGVEYINVPILDKLMFGISHDKESNNKIKRELPDMPELYRKLVTDEQCVSRIKNVMKIILDKNREGTILWHCSEGKDRCGIISALFLFTKGISKEDVMKDYLQTNKASTFKAWRYYFLLLFLFQGFNVSSKVRDAFLAKREYIEPIMDILIDMSRELVRDGE